MSTQGRLVTYDPLNPYHAANKKYVDEKIAQVGTGGGTNVIISDTEPEDVPDGTLWFDTRETKITNVEGVKF